MSHIRKFTTWLSVMRDRRDGEMADVRMARFHIPSLIYQWLPITGRQSNYFAWWLPGARRVGRPVSRAGTGVWVTVQGQGCAVGSQPVKRWPAMIYTGPNTVVIGSQATLKSVRLGVNLLSHGGKTICNSQQPWLGRCSPGVMTLLQSLMRRGDSLMLGGDLSDPVKQLGSDFKHDAIRKYLRREMNSSNNK